MSYSESIVSAKPYITGFVIGVIAAPIVAFSAGWVSTSWARAEAVERAQIDTLAGVCSNKVVRSFAAQNLHLATLKGWDHRAARNDLVTKAMTEIEVPDLLAAQIVAGCNKTLA